MGYVEWPTAFDHTKSQMGQFPHGSTDDHHHGPTFVNQVFAEGLNHWVKTPSVNRGEVKRFTQVAAANLGQPAPTPQRCSRLVLSRRQTDKGSQLAGAAKVSKGNFSQQRPR